jgi:hypothetical protein
MPSTAFSAQNSVFSIGTGTGTAKNITAIAVGNPTVLTSTAHGLSNGDVVTLAGLTGADAALLNGQSVVVLFKTANTIAVAIDTTGKTITAAGTATPVSYTPIKNIKSFNGFDGKATIIDVTNLDSTAKEKRPGLQDSGKFMFDLHVDYDDAGQAAARTAMGAGAQKNFKLTYPNGKVASFSGYVMSMPSQGGVDAVVAGSAEIEISGSIVIA